MEVTDTEKIIGVSSYSELVDNEQQAVNNGFNNGKICKIPRDENGNIIGMRWEVIRERMYDNLSKHYGVDLKTL
jgi:hypothetical protein